ncbi:hypothetical protein TDB9533_02875 [Thalassocella blandensis]|nr:hypothetical protein TDB9533_02875 [Thalassocella blandensis]
MVGVSDGTPYVVQITSHDDIAFKNESEVADIFFVKAIFMVLFLGVCVFVILGKYKNEVMAFFSKTSSLSNEEKPLVKSIKLSPKTSLHIVNTEGKTFAITESLVNTDILDISKCTNNQPAKEISEIRAEIRAEIREELRTEIETTGQEKLYPGTKPQGQGEGGE